ncbi:hypothetical protein RQP46_006630 [Phenoliferia psychrophenolica]
MASAQGNGWISANGSEPSPTPPNLEPSITPSETPTPISTTPSTPSTSSSTIVSTSTLNLIEVYDAATSTSPKKVDERFRVLVEVLQEATKTKKHGLFPTRTSQLLIASGFSYGKSFKDFIEEAEKASIVTVKPKGLRGLAFSTARIFLNPDYAARDETAVEEKE